MEVKSLVVSMLLLVTACATLPTRQHSSQVFTLPRQINIDETWQGLVTYVTERGWVVTVMDGDSKFLTTDRHSALQSDLDCGTPGLTTERNPRARVSVTLRESQTDGSVTMTMGTIP